MYCHLVPFLLNNNSHMNSFLLICNNTKDLNAHKLQRIGTLDTVLVFAKPCNLSDKEWQEVKERKLHYYSLPRKTIDVQLLPNN